MRVIKECFLFDFFPIVKILISIFMAILNPTRLKTYLAIDYKFPRAGAREISFGSEGDQEKLDVLCLSYWPRPNHEADEAGAWAGRCLSPARGTLCTLSLRGWGRALRNIFGS